MFKMCFYSVCYLPKNWFSFQPSMDFLYRLNVPFLKIGSADTTNLPLLRHVAKYQKPLVISTGMTSFDNVLKVYNEISQLNERFAIMQCTSSYPTCIKEVNLNVIKVRYFICCINFMMFFMTMKQKVCSLVSL